MVSHVIATATFGLLIRGGGVRDRLTMVGVTVTVGLAVLALMAIVMVVTDVAMIIGSAAPWAEGAVVPRRSRRKACHRRVKSSWNGIIIYQKTTSRF